MFAVLFVFTASPVYASTISFSPATVNVTKGQTFTLGVSVNAAGTKVYTVKAEVAYPATLLEVTGFAFGSGWMPLSAAGYDLTDNTAGKLTKTGGFTGGFIDTKTLGTITFKAKADGTATVSVGSASIAYDAQNKNTFNGAQGSAIITVATIVPASNATTTQKQVITQQSAGVVATTTVMKSLKHTIVPITATTTEKKDIVPTTTMATSATSSVAAVGVVSGTLSSYWKIVLSILIVIMLGFLMYRHWNRRNTSF